ncbi:MAG: hypothetical protein R3360_02950 [Alphaproteobacteria bacterium]|nr:hypothetical protein [Alphaproteobacteria bacterium]
MDSIKTRSIGIFKMVSVPVFFISVSIILGAVAYFSIESEAATSLFSYLLDEVSRSFGWL